MNSNIAARLLNGFVILLLGLQLSMAAAPPNPVAVFQFGTNGIGFPLTNQFQWANQSDADVTVLSVTPSCECVQVLHWPSNISAGAVGIVDILFLPDKAGEVDYRVLVKTSSAAYPEWEWAIQGVVTAGPPTRLIRDWNLYLGTEESAQLIGDPGQRMIVDVRPADEYAQARVPNSLNIPLYAVKTKLFLKGRRIVLMDQGNMNVVLEEECRKLRAMGFPDVSLWYGGLNAWRRRGGSVEGLGPADVAAVKPVWALDIFRATDWLVVGLNSNASESVEGGMVCPFDPAHPELFAAAVNAAIETRPEVGSVLVVADEGMNMAEVMATAPRINAFLFHLEGGWAAWASHQKLMAAIRQGPSWVVNQSSGSGGARVRPGCGGCPKK